MPQKPAAAWSTFSDRYNNLTSLALSGDLILENEQIYECNLQLMYAAPDSFAFLAEGTLGVDLARGAIIGESGFWEIPREGISEILLAGDLISLPDDDIAIDPIMLIRAVYFFRDLEYYGYERRSGSKLNFVRHAADSAQVMELNRDSATPAGQIFYSGSDTMTVGYSGWSTEANKVLFPRRIEAFSAASGLRITYSISKLKYNPKIDLSNFLPKL